MIRPNETDRTELIPLPELAQHLPARPDGRRVNYSTIWAWVRWGLQGVRLETVMIGGRRYVSPEALDRFVNRRTGLRSPPAPLPRRTSRSTTHRYLRQQGLLGEEEAADDPQIPQIAAEEKA